MRLLLTILRTIWPVFRGAHDRAAVAELEKLQLTGARRMARLYGVPQGAGSLSLSAEPLCLRDFRWSRLKRMAPRTLFAVSLLLVAIWTNSLFQIYTQYAMEGYYEVKKCV